MRTTPWGGDEDFDQKLSLRGVKVPRRKLKRMKLEEAGLERQAQVTCGLLCRNI
jgi:hypothetical protein